MMKHTHDRVNVKKFFSYAVGFPCRCGASKPCRPGFSTRSSQLDRVAKRGMLTHLVALATAEFNGRAPSVPSPGSTRAQDHPPM